MKQSKQNLEYHQAIFIYRYFCDSSKLGSGWMLDSMCKKLKYLLKFNSLKCIH